MPDSRSSQPKSLDSAAARVAEWTTRLVLLEPPQDPVRPGEQQVEDVLLVPRQLVPPNHVGLVERYRPNGDPGPVLDELEVVGNLHDGWNLQAPSHSPAICKRLNRSHLRGGDAALVTASAVSADTSGDSF